MRLDPISATTFIAVMWFVPIFGAHPRWSRFLGVTLPFGAIAAVLYLHDGWLPAAAAILGAALLWWGPARAVFFEMPEVRTWRSWPRTSVRVLVAVTLVAAALGVATLAGLDWASILGAAWWNVLSVAVCVPLWGYFVMDAIFDPFLASTIVADRREAHGRLRDVSRVKTGSGRSTRYHNCVEFDGDETVWKVPWVRQRTLARRRGATYSYTVLTMANGRRMVRGFHRDADNGLVSESGWDTSGARAPHGRAGVRDEPCQRHVCRSGQ